MNPIHPGKFTLLHNSNYPQNRQRRSSCWCVHYWYAGLAPAQSGRVSCSSCSRICVQHWYAGLAPAQSGRFPRNSRRRTGVHHWYAGLAPAQSGRVSRNSCSRTCVHPWYAGLAPFWFRKAFDRCSIESMGLATMLIECSLCIKASLAGVTDCHFIKEPRGREGGPTLERLAPDSQNPKGTDLVDLTARGIGGWLAKTQGWCRFSPNRLSL
jgi:hypothetical protein